jgi:hypothetical protein
MHKLKLNLDDIDVMSFEIRAPATAGQGTVRARGATEPEGCHLVTEFEGCHENTDFDGCYWITELDGCYDNTEMELCYWITEFLGCHWAPPTNT